MTKIIPTKKEINKKFYETALIHDLLLSEFDSFFQTGYIKRTDLDKVSHFVNKWRAETSIVCSSTKEQTMTPKQSQKPWMAPTQTLIGVGS